MADFFLILNERNIFNRAAVREAVRSGADVLALKITELSDALPALRSADEILAEVENAPKLAIILPSAVFSAGGEAEILNELTALNILDVFYFSVSEKNASILFDEENRRKSGSFARKYKSLLVMPWNIEDRKSLLRKAHENGFSGIIYQCALPDKKRGEYLAELRQIALETQNCGLKAGIAGNLQSPDIPRLLPYQPDYLEFIEETVTKQMSGYSRKEADLSRDIKVKRNSASVEKSKLGTDKILVSDFIVPLNIGAYNHEKGADQRVCFNVAAEIARISHIPHNMDDIFSYDIILDAISHLAGQGHWEFVENLAEELAAFLLGFPRVEQVTIRVEKLDLAPRAVGVEITRAKP